MTLEPTGTLGTPWGGYAALVDGVQVGECAFKTMPVHGRVEIAYHTFDAFRGRGYATAMARGLIEIARLADARLLIRAQTLPGTNASVALLQKLGFEFQGTVHHAEDGDVWEWHLPNQLG